MFNKDQYYRKKLWVLLMFLPFFISCRTTRLFVSDPVEPTKYREKKIFEFLDIMNETSGLEFFDNRFWTFNDSGGEPLLYAFRPGSKDQDLQFYFTGLINIDWEDICADDSCIYIADIGNNAGWRDTLFIYRISYEGLLSGKNNFENIGFSFAEKTTDYSDCNPNPFDCEALVALDDSLWIFTKNWQDQTSSVYKIPAKEGYYNISASERIDPAMLVTGADYNQGDNTLWLIGYRHFVPVICKYRITAGKLEKMEDITFWSRTGLQVEAICTDDEGNIFFTNEKSIKRQAFWRLIPVD